MAEASSSEYEMFNNGIQRGHWTVDVADWSNAQDSSEESHQKRSDIVCAIITHLLTDDLRKILASGWDVNEILPMSMLIAVKCKPMTALQGAVEWGWTEGVKLLFDAGADYKTPGVLEMLLKLALPKYTSRRDLIDLLLKHGADPNPSEKVFASFPLGQAIAYLKYNDDYMSIVKLFLKNGADPNVTIPSEQLCQYKCPLSESVDLIAGMIDAWNSDGIRFCTPMVNNILRLTAELSRILVEFGADVNWNIDGTKPLLHRMVNCGVAQRTSHQILEITKSENPTKLYLQEHLDIFYQNGSNINMEYGDFRTPLEYAVREDAHSNSVRWLIRHGANVHPTLFTSLIKHFVPANKRRSNLHQLVEETPLILLRAGTRVSNGAMVHLIGIKKELSTWKERHLTQGRRENLRIVNRIKDLRAKLVKEGNDLEKLGKKFEKCIFPEFWSKQMVDLGEFSDDSLNMYPESIPEKFPDKDELTFVSDQIHKVLEFLSQPQSLQWYCRRWVRENLVSLQPSVVKTLPVSARMKRYILCHEI